MQKKELSKRDPTELLPCVSPSLLHMALTRNACFSPSTAPGCFPSLLSYHTSPWPTMFQPCHAFPALWPWRVLGFLHRKLSPQPSASLALPHLPSPRPNITSPERPSLATQTLVGLPCCSLSQHPVHFPHSTYHNCDYIFVLGFCYVFPHISI